MSEFIEKLKKRWGVHTYGQLALILFIFSITGMTALVVRKFLFDLFGITENTSSWIKVIAWILTVFPSYQILFLFYGFILGQFEFVWRFEKKSMRRIKSLFVKSE
ncbi:MAG: DUF6787 family protein [Balneolaceae bacterium]|nr:DUF6787 family protein [Balneolaceae bacterium]